MQELQSSRSSVNLSLGDSAVLAGVTFDLDNGGRVKSRPLLLRTTANMRFVNRVFNQLFPEPVVLDTSCSGWCCLQRYISVRHRITHPKPNASYDISDQEWGDFQVALHWFNQLILEYIKSARPNRRTQISKAIDELSHRALDASATNTAEASSHLLVRENYGVHAIQAPDYSSG